MQSSRTLYWSRARIGFFGLHLTDNLCPPSIQENPCDAEKRNSLTSAVATLRTSRCLALAKLKIYQFNQRGKRLLLVQYARASTLFLITRLMASLDWSACARMVS